MMAHRVPNVDGVGSCSGRCDIGAWTARPKVRGERICKKRSENVQIVLEPHQIIYEVSKSIKEDFDSIDILVHPLANGPKIRPQSLTNEGKLSQTSLVRPVTGLPPLGSASCSMI
ncbi:hypothetical protein Fmac_025462 [Flemingia macrophylla]|uniref:Uncharacterized protein n=1 Tax=Flemingia macrophylla TaxID=520843 RepID=A0ABD1LSC9_9FABA